ncbi:MAG: YcjX family protein, partial [Pseudomonadota bacterium]
LSFADEARIAFGNLADFAGDMVEPTIRVGVTGLSRAGKTVFITALVHALTRGGRFPMFEAQTEGRIASAAIKAQPDPAVPRFAIEDHLGTLTGVARTWPESTRQISELRLRIGFDSAKFLKRNLGRGQLTLDIVDYPGEWLLDLALIGKDYETWSRETLVLAGAETRAPLAKDWRSHLQTLDPNGPEDAVAARTSSELFRSYLISCRDERVSLSTLPPGRFLMPGDLDGSPALTFAPLPEVGEAPKPGSLHALMASRYDAYKTHVVLPFFRNHFARLDRQIVLVDALAALNAGPNAVQDLERALSDILVAFRVGSKSIIGDLIGRRIDRLLFAATKADQLHHANHPRLEAILRRLVDRGIAHAGDTGAEVDVMALAAIRATREATVTQNGSALDCIVGTPEPGQTVAGRTFDGTSEFAYFPGDLPSDPDQIFDPSGKAYRGLEQAGAGDSGADTTDLRFLRFRPPLVEMADGGLPGPLPHIRMDRALQFLLGDRLS